MAVGGPLGDFRDHRTYKLSVTEETDDDYASSIGTDGEVGVGASVTAHMDYISDYDWFAVVLEANRTYRFDVEGRSTDGDAPLEDPVFRWDLQCQRRSDSGHPG